MRFDLTDLQLVVGADAGGTLTAGAESAGMTVASASERLRGLESRLGMTLFERGPRGLAPTAAGRALLGHARQALAQVEAMRRELGEHRDGVAGRVRLSCNTAACRELLPDVLASFLPAHPAMNVTLAEARSEAVVAALAAGDAELGVISDAVDGHGLEQAPLRPDPLVLLVPAGHALAGRDAVSLLDTFGHDFVGLVPGSALQEHLDAQAARLAGRIGYRLRVQELGAVCAMVARGIGLGVVPERVATRWTGASADARSSRVRAIRLDDAWARRQLVLVARSFDGLAPAGRRLAHHLRATLAQPAGVRPARTIEAGP